MPCIPVLDVLINPTPAELAPSERGLRGTLRRHPSILSMPRDAFQLGITIRNTPHLSHSLIRPYLLS
jgi:hypothetical protein